DVPGEQRRSDHRLAEQFGDRTGVLVGGPDPLPAAGEPDMHPAHAGAGQEETGQPVAAGRVGFGHGVIARSRRAWSNREAPSSAPVTDGDVMMMAQAGPPPAGSRRRRRWWRRLLWLPAWLLLASVMQVLVLRFVDPPFSAFMAIRQVDAWRAGQRDFRIAHDWRDLDAMAPCLPVALIAAEDQNFATHSGFDFEAIRQARERNARGGRLRGGSTISQQVAKNLFLWQGSSAASRWVRKGLEAWYTVLLELL